MTRKLISLMHVSLDGFCAGPKGEMDWIGLNETIFADAAGYGGARTAPCPVGGED
jgi:hypothetical protein